jgi:hypothetical protein
MPYGCPVIYGVPKKLAHHDCGDKVERGYLLNMPPSYYLNGQKQRNKTEKKLYR